MATQTDRRTDAQVYADSIADTVRTLEALYETPEGSWGGREWGDTLSRLGITDNSETPSEAVAAWLGDTLEVTVMRGMVGNTDRVRVEVLVTFGGPNAWVIFDPADGRDTLSVECYWGGDSHRVAVYAPNIFGWIDDYAEAVTA